MPFGNEMFLLGRSPARTTLREITVEVLLHLMVENDAEISASLPLDLLCSLLMEVGRDRRRGFAGSGESVVENLTFAGALSVRKRWPFLVAAPKHMARKKSFRSGLRVVSDNDRCTLLIRGCRHMLLPAGRRCFRCREKAKTGSSLP
jgi:hypothetical protein